MHQAYLNLFLLLMGVVRPSSLAGQVTSVFIAFAVISPLITVPDNLDYNPRTGLPWNSLPGCRT